MQPVQWMIVFYKRNLEKRQGDVRGNEQSFCLFCGSIYRIQHESFSFVCVNILHIVHLHVLLILHRQQQVGIRRSRTELVARQYEEGQSGQFIQQLWRATERWVTAED